MAKKTILMLINDYGPFKAVDVLKHRLSHKIWGLNKGTMYAGNLKNEIKIIFYVAGRKDYSQHFFANAKIRNAIPFKETDLELYNPSSYWMKVRPITKLILEDIKYFKNPVPIKEIMPKLDLFNRKNHVHYGKFLQGGIKYLSNNDTDILLRHSL